MKGYFQYCSLWNNPELHWSSIRNKVEKFPLLSPPKEFGWFSMCINYCCYQKVLVMPLQSAPSQWSHWFLVIEATVERMTLHLMQECVGQLVHSRLSLNSVLICLLSFKLHVNKNCSVFTVTEMIQSLTVERNLTSTKLCVTISKIVGLNSRSISALGYK